MDYQWNDEQPIYRQVMGEIVEWILTGKLKDGDVLPSIRKLASHFQVNPLTASKACQELSHENVVSSQRGIGLFVCDGARHMLQVRERRIFMEKEVPVLARRLKAMNVSLKELNAALIGQGC